MRTHELISETKDYNVFRIHWDGGSGLDYHGHADSEAGIYVLSGVLTEHLLTCDGEIITELKPGHSRVVTKDSIHKVVNYGIEPTISIHCYYPPLHLNYDKELEIS